MKGFLIRGAAALVLFLALVTLRVKDHYPALPNPIEVDLVLERGEPGRSDPLIVAGRGGKGDFLCVRFKDEHTVFFVYDSWGRPGIVSTPIHVEPGKPIRLRIDMPALDQIQAGIAPPSSRVRISADGVTVLDTNAHFYPREPERIFFGLNPIGGTACGVTLRGRLVAADGRILYGSPDGVFPSGPRLLAWLLGWLKHFPQQVIVLLLFSVATVSGVHLLATRERIRRTAARAVARHRWFAGAAAFAAVGYAWLVTLGSFQFNYSETGFGSFYDYQIASLLEGRLDVPEDAIGGEAFESRGKIYGYFGPTPALLRLPFAITGLAFGKLSRTFMLLYFVASLVAAYLILREAMKHTGRRPVGQTSDLREDPSPVAVLILVGSAGLGSTIFFLGSQGIVFHEAILGGITFALWSGWCSLRHLREPTRRWWIGALGCGVLSLHTRPPTGLFALTLLGCVVLAIAARDWRERNLARNLWRHFAIAALCAAGVLSLNGLAYLKFHTFDVAPLRLSRPYFNAARLAFIDGKSFHAANVPFNFYTYLVRPNFRLERGFPWIYLGSPQPGRFFPKAKIDLPDHTLAIPYAMPSLFALATLGCLGAMLVSPGARPAIGALWAAVMPMTLALFAAIATAQRYTGDFCPFLICAAAFGLAAIDQAARRWRTALLLIAAALTLAAIAVTVALTLHYQGGYLWSVPEPARKNYLELRRRVDGFFGVPAPPHP